MNGGDGNMNELTESFFLWVKVGQAQVHYTNNRYGTLSEGSLKAFVTQGWAGCKIRLEETTYSVGGRSINDVGVRGKTIRNVNFDTQAKVDSYCAHLVRMYHAPLVYIDATIKPEYSSAEELMGKTIALFDNFQNDFADFTASNRNTISKVLR